MAELNDAPNYTDMFARSYQAGRQQAEQKGVQNALSMVQTDPVGAQNALMQYGQFGMANELAQRQAGQRQLQVQQQAAPQIAGGDMAGAASTLAQGGQYDAAAAIGKLDDAQRAHAVQTADLVSKAAFGLSQLPQEQRAAGLAKLKPLLLAQHVPEEQIDGVDLSDQGLQTVAAQAMSVKDHIAAQQKTQEIQNAAEHNKAELAMSGQKFQEDQRHNRVSEGISAQNASTEAAKAASSQVQVLQDRDGTPYTYNAGTRVATTLDGQPYAPKGAQKLGSSNPRSAVAMATQRFMQEHPDASADDLASFNAKVGKMAKAAKDFATGPQGKTVNSLNVGIDHLNTMGELASALQNGDIPLFNKIAKDVAVATGKPAPTNFDAAKQIVAGEIVKAISGGGGGVHDREEAAATINRTSSPAQLLGAIATQKKLFAGQLHGLRLQYKNGTGQDDFESHLTPQAARELDAIPIDAPPPSAMGGQGGAKPSLQTIFGH